MQDFRPRSKPARTQPAHGGAGPKAPQRPLQGLALHPGRCDLLLVNQMISVRRLGEMAQGAFDLEP